MLYVILGILGSWTLGHPSYPVRHGSLGVLRSHPYLAAVVSVAVWYHPDKEVNHASRLLWNPRLSDCFYLTRKTSGDTIPGEAKEAAERRGTPRPRLTVGRHRLVLPQLPGLHRPPVHEVQDSLLTTPTSTA